MYYLLQAAGCSALKAKKRYTFTALKALVSPPGSASLKVLVENALNVGQANKNVTIQKPGSAPITVPTDVNGIAVFTNADPGSYQGQVDNGGVMVNFTKDINTGVDARVTVIV